MENEMAIRLMIFLGLFTLLALAEVFLPRRKRDIKRSPRWFTNISLIIIDSFTIRLMAFILPVMAVTAAADADAHAWGLLGLINWPNWVEVMITILILDFVIWTQHLITHKIPILWRLHQVHHADRDMDVTTAIRFHPIEIALSMILKIGMIYALGPTAFAVILFEILLNGTAMFNHANIRLPKKLDQVIRLLIVTPDMHRVHHSHNREEHDSNYGFSLSIWDRLFGTYVAQPAKGHDDMTIGLGWQGENPQKLSWCLLLPFYNK